MHWLEEWRRARQCSRAQLARLCEPCSAGLIRRLEEERGFVTVPGIAARIAKITGATAEQYDTLVPERCRGQWNPGSRKEPPKIAPDEPGGQKMFSIKPSGGRQARQILQIDMSGRIAARYSGRLEAAVAVERGEEFVSSRLLKRKLEGNEFMPLGFTFRYKEDWNEAERARLMETAAELQQARETGVVRFGQQRFLVIDGVQKPIGEWAGEYGLSVNVIRQRLKTGWSPKEAVMSPLRRELKKGKK